MKNYFQLNYFNFIIIMASIIIKIIFLLLNFMVKMDSFCFNFNFNYNIIKVFRFLLQYCFRANILFTIYCIIQIIIYYL